MAYEPQFEIVPPKPKYCDCNASTAISGELSFGKGKLDYYGFWEIPCPHERPFAELREKPAA